ncbi:MAG: 5-Hydroxyisourate Hydrolase (HIUase) [Bacteroidetes bacterium]|nr:5-Hydroxyisourate Hydrolase (HIUase) [Bacteroidota bacterium]
MQSPITTHVLDTSIGRPAEGVYVTLDFHDNGTAWKTIATGVTNADGRVTNLLHESAKLARGIYRLTFDTASYFHDQEALGFYPSVMVIFEINDPSAHYHVPLLLSPHGYTTYRGS